MSEEIKNEDRASLLPADQSAEVQTEALPILRKMLDHAVRRVEVYNRKLREWSIPGCTVSSVTIKADRQARDVYLSHVRALTVAIEKIGSADQFLHDDGTAPHDQDGVIVAGGGDLTFCENCGEAVVRAWVTADEAELCEACFREVPSSVPASGSPR